MKKHNDDDNDPLYALSRENRLSGVFSEGILTTLWVEAGIFMWSSFIDEKTGAQRFPVIKRGAMGGAEVSDTKYRDLPFCFFTAQHRVESSKPAA